LRQPRHERSLGDMRLMGLPTVQPPPTLTAIAGAVIGLSRGIAFTPARERIEIIAHEALRWSLLDDAGAALGCLLALHRIVVDREIAGLAPSDHQELVAVLEPIAHHGVRWQRSA
jgi:hypothetical protein